MTQSVVIFLPGDKECFHSTTLEYLVAVGVTNAGVDFTNVFRARFLRRFSYKHLFSSYVLLRARFSRAKNVDEIGLIEN